MTRLVLFCLLLVTAQAFAQTLSDAEKAYDERQNVLHKQAAAAVADKQYPEAERLYLEMLQLLEAQPPEFQQKWGRHIHPELLYNIACYQSLQGKRKAALKSFEAACAKGYDDFRHVKNDTDLDNIRGDKTFQRLHQAMRATSDFVHILQTAESYTPGGTDSLPVWQYAAPNDRDLVRVRAYFKLDSVAGSGDELSKIQRLLTFVHDRIRHDGRHGNPSPMHALALDDSCRDGSRGLNCRGLATILNECYLAMGLPSRFVTCMPKEFKGDCHVINTVYSSTLDKWVWVDPTQNAWVMDEKGVMLSIAEVRERLRDGRPLQLNPTANWNNQRPATKENYLENYMAKNLYYIVCSDRSEFGTEVRREGVARPRYLALCPVGYTPDYNTAMYRVTTDDSWFWQSPYKK